MSKTVYVVQVKNGDTQWVDYTPHKSKRKALKTAKLVRPCRIIRRTEEVVND